MSILSSSTHHPISAASSPHFPSRKGDVELYRDYLSSEDTTPPCSPQVALSRELNGLEQTETSLHEKIFNAFISSNPLKLKAGTITEKLREISEIASNSLHSYNPKNDATWTSPDGLLKIIETTHNIEMRDGIKDKKLFDQMKEWIKDENLLKAAQKIHVASSALKIYESSFTLSTPKENHAARAALVRMVLINSPQIKDSTQLDLSGLGLTEMPPELCKLENLNYIDLSGNHLTKLPNDMSDLLNLEVLDLSSNQFPDVPPVIGLLTNLKHLDLEHNNIRTGTDIIGRLTKLIWLELGHNHLTSLSKDISNNVELGTLNVSFNKLKKIPKEFGRLTKLLFINFKGNRIINIPSEFKHFREAYACNISGNQLNTLPAELQNLEKLCRLGLKGNPLNYIPISLTYYLQRKKITDLSDSDLSLLGIKGAIVTAFKVVMCVASIFVIKMAYDRFK